MGAAPGGATITMFVSAGRVLSQPACRTGQRGYLLFILSFVLSCADSNAGGSLGLLALWSLACSKKPGWGGSAGQYSVVTPWELRMQSCFRPIPYLCVALCFHFFLGGDGARNRIILKMRNRNKPCGKRAGPAREWVFEWRPSVPLLSLRLSPLRSTLGCGSFISRILFVWSSLAVLIVFVVPAAGLVTPLCWLGRGLCSGRLTRRLFSC